MADLLECLIQIAALRDALEMATDRRSAGLSPEPRPAAVSGPRLADAERRFAAALGAADAGTASSRGDAEDERRAFVALRRANLAKLDACTAAQLCGLVTWPGRPSTTVADLVAIMLANDTEALCELRSARLVDRSR